MFGWVGEWVGGCARTRVSTHVHPAWLCAHADGVESSCTTCTHARSRMYGDTRTHRHVRVFGSE